MVSVPLVQLSAANPEAQLILMIGDEIFINSGREVIFDQNRVIISPTFQLNKSWSISATRHGQLASGSIVGNFTYTNVLGFQIRHYLNYSYNK